MRRSRSGSRSDQCGVTDLQKVTQWERYQWNESVDAVSVGLMVVVLSSFPCYWTWPLHLLLRSSWNVAAKRDRRPWPWEPLGTGTNCDFHAAPELGMFLLLLLLLFSWCFTVLFRRAELAGNVSRQAVCCELRNWQEMFRYVRCELRIFTWHTGNIAVESNRFVWNFTSLGRQPFVDSH